jgi:hypothetical protein
MINWKTKAKFIFYLKNLCNKIHIYSEVDVILFCVTFFIIGLICLNTGGFAANFAVIIFCIFMLMVYFSYFCFQHPYQRINPHDRNVLDNILFRKKNSVKIQFELNKLDLAMQSNSDVYKGFSSDDFPYLTKLIKRYKRYNDFKEKEENNNEKVYQNDIYKINTSKESNPQLLLTMYDVDNELNKLINNQFKKLNTEKQFNVIETTNKKHTGTNNESNKTWN